MDDEELNERINSGPDLINSPDTKSIKGQVFTELKVNKDDKFHFSFQELCLWLLVFTLLGIGVGTYSMRVYYIYSTAETVSLQGIIHGNQVYDVLPSPTKKIIK